MKMILLSTVLFSMTQLAWANKSCDFYQDFIDQGVPKDALQRAIKYFQNNKTIIKNKDYISIADYSINSGKKRFFLLNMSTGEVEKFHVSHGSGKFSWKEKDKSGKWITRVKRFGGSNSKIGVCSVADKKWLANINESQRQYILQENNRRKELNKKRSSKNKLRMLGYSPKHDRYALTRPGFFVTSNLYTSASHQRDFRVFENFEQMSKADASTRGWPNLFSAEITGTKRATNGMRMHGKSKGVNHKAHSQGVVMHEAFYNKVYQLGYMGRSFGCPAFQPFEGRDVMAKIKNGSLFYAHIPKCRNDQSIIDKQISNWQSVCK